MRAASLQLHASYQIRFDSFPCVVGTALRSRPRLIRDVCGETSLPPLAAIIAELASLAIHRLSSLTSHLSPSAKQRPDRVSCDPAPVSLATREKQRGGKS